MPQQEVETFLYLLNASLTCGCSKLSVGLFHLCSCSLTDLKYLIQFFLFSDRKYSYAIINKTLILELIKKPVRQLKRAAKWIKELMKPCCLWICLVFLPFTSVLMTPSVPPTSPKSLPQYPQHPPISTSNCSARSWMYCGWLCATCLLIS